MKSGRYPLFSGAWAIVKFLLKREQAGKNDSFLIRIEGGRSQRAWGIKPA
jgi:hypothetical protein